MSADKYLHILSRQIVVIVCLLVALRAVTKIHILCALTEFSVICKEGAIFFICVERSGVYLKKKRRISVNERE